MRSRMVVFLALLSLLTACANAPMGPRVMALPGQAMSYERFRQIDTYCRSEASRQLQEAPTDTQAAQMVKAGIVTGLIGAAAGAIIGGVTGNPGRGAAIGGASGGVVGAAGGAGSGQRVAEEQQRMYDQAYTACIYAQGGQIPSMATMSR